MSNFNFSGRTRNARAVLRAVCRKFETSGLLGFLVLALIGCFLWMIHRKLPLSFVHPVQKTTKVGTTTAKPELEVIGWEKGKSRDPTKYLQPYTDTTIISGEKICENSNAVVVICTSRPDSFTNRAAVRETWASVNLSVKVGFLVGVTNARIQKLIQEENRRYHDVIQENIIDTYANLTIKSIALLKWYIRWCPDSSFLMKVDDDTFVDLKLLLDHLGDYQSLGTLFGYLYSSAEVVRDVRHKWYVPEYMYSNKTYPPYLNGPAYVMSRDVAYKLYATALATPIFHLEDVYLTGICAQKAKIKLQHFLWFSRLIQSNTSHTKCPRHHVACHPLYPRQMRYLWKQRNSPRRISKKKYTT